MTDQIRTCESCSMEFNVTASELLFYASRGYNQPANCPECRAKLRAERHSALLATADQVGSTARLGTYGGFAPPPPRSTDNGRFTAVCSSCGGEAVVPFQPRSGRPVYCRKCFSTRRPN